MKLLDGRVVAEKITKTMLILNYGNTKMIL